MASVEMNMAKQVQLLCKAADLEPKNKGYRSDCEVRKAALINNDRQALRTALDANDNGQTAKAKRYAGYVSAFDPETHRQAEQLLAKLNGSEPPSQSGGNPPADKCNECGRSDKCECRAKPERRSRAGPGDV